MATGKRARVGKISDRSLMGIPFGLGPIPNLVLMQISDRSLSDQGVNRNCSNNLESRATVRLPYSPYLYALYPETNVCATVRSSSVGMP